MPEHAWMYVSNYEYVCVCLCESLITVSNVDVDDEPQVE